MPTSEFFQRFKLCTIRNFFDSEQCARLHAEIHGGSRHRATVVCKDVSRIDEQVRRTKCIQVSATTQALVMGQIVSIRDRLAGHFGIALGKCENPQFLVYETGDFFLPHRDIGPHQLPEYTSISGRRVSVVIFLNGEEGTPSPHSYIGGALVFYGLMDDPRAKDIGFPLIGEAGLLVAFPSDLRHAVTPVTAGTRYTVVSWFH